jgi:hypothetical protein
LFAHVGGFVFGYVVARCRVVRGQLRDDHDAPVGAWA